MLNLVSHNRGFCVMDIIAVDFRNHNKMLCIWLWFVGYTTSIHLKRRKEWFPNVSQLTHSFPRRSRARRGAGRNCFYYFYRATFSLPHFSVTIPVRKTRHSTYWLSFTCCKNIFRSPQWRSSQPILSFCYTHLCLHFVFIYGQFSFFCHFFGKTFTYFWQKYLPLYEACLWVSVRPIFSSKVSLNLYFG